MGNQRVFIDKGVYEYNAGKRRRLSRSTKSHNTVTVGGYDQCEFWHSFRVARRASVEVLDYEYLDGKFRIKARHDGYTRLKGNPIHQRELIFNGEELTIRDEIKNGEHQEAKTRFLLHPDVKIRQLEAGLHLEFEKTALLFATNLSFKVEETSWYPNFGVEESCMQIIADLGEVPCKGQFKIELLKTKT
ncbi:MAG: heparinase II/III-family protein [Balneolaceae bacterium]|nr:heparinase II/III-family protein [Balneolaceae bacterium]